MTIKLRKFLLGLCVLSITSGVFATQVNAYSQSKSNDCGKNGKLTVNVWRQTSPTESGNTLQWDYQVSSTYSGKKAVKEIKTAWRCSADLRKSASLSLSLSIGDSISASASKSWQTKSTKMHYWSNTNGAKTSSYRSNVCIGPKKNYEKDSICTYNTGSVQLKVAKTIYKYNFTASV